MLLALLLAFSPHADAACCGKIKRIRIRPTNTGGRRIIVVVQDDDGQQVTTVDRADWEGASVTTRFTPTDGGPAIDDVTAEDWTRQRRTFVSDTLSGVSATAITVSVGEESVSLDLAAPEGGAKSSAWVAESTETYSISARIGSFDGADGQIAVRVQGMSKKTSLDNIESVTITASAEAPLDADKTTEASLALDAARARASEAVAADGTSSIDGYTYDYTTTLYNADGETVDTATGSVVMGDGAVARGVCSSKVKQKRNGNLKHTVFTTSDSADSDYSLDVLIAARADGETLLSTTGETSVDRERHFTVDRVAFDGEVAGEVYSLTLYPLDKEGSLVGAPVDTELAFGTSGDQVQARWGDGFAGIDASGESVNLALAGDALEPVTSVELVFNEPYDGPDPIETSVVVPLSLEWTRFVQTARAGEADLSSGVDVEVQLYDEADGLLDEMTYGGSLGKQQDRCADILFKPSLIGID